MRTMPVRRRTGGAEPGRRRGPRGRRRSRRCRRWRRCRPPRGSGPDARAAVQPALDLGQEGERGWARSRTRSGRRASSTRPVMCAVGADDAVGLAVTWTWWRPSPPRMTGSASSAQPADREALDEARHLVEVGAGVEEAPRAMSPAMPAKQWNQATVVIGGVAFRRSSRRRVSHERRSAVRAVPGRRGCGRRRRRRRSRCRCRRPSTPGGAAGQHGQQGGDPLEGGAVAGAGRHRHDGRAVRPPTAAGQRPLHAGHHDDDVGRRGRSSASRRWTPATPTSASGPGRQPRAARVAAALVGHREVGGAGAGDDGSPGPAGAGPPHASGRPGRASARRLRRAAAAAWSRRRG